MKTVLIALLMSLTFVGCKKDDCGCKQITYKIEDGGPRVEISRVDVECQAELELKDYNDVLSYSVECN